MDFNKQVSRIEIWSSWCIFFRARHLCCGLTSCGHHNQIENDAEKTKPLLIRNTPNGFENCCRLDPHLKYEEICGGISESFDVRCITPRQIRFCFHEHKITRKKLELLARSKKTLNGQHSSRLSGCFFPEKTSFFEETNRMERELEWGEDTVSLIADFQHFGGYSTQRVTPEAALQLHFSILKAFLKPGYTI